MGRVSKRKAASLQTAIRAGDGKRYKAGIYARLSSDQDVKKNESVEVQIEIAKKFVEEFNLNNAGEVIDVMECYTDLGKTGSNFEREGVQRLLQDIRIGVINCVIVKDLSRFGRNYLEAGNYIEKVFPFLGVRFIAVADGFDTGNAGNGNKQMVSEIKNLVNDMYAKDFSKKARIHLQQRREEGSYVGGPPPYGYLTTWKGKKRVLVPDENTALIVSFIYEKFVETENYTTVADELNRRKINPPNIYKKTGNVYFSGHAAEYKGWDKSAVERILKSETYAGALVQGKTAITARNEKNRVSRSEDEWVVIRDAHELLVEKELYEKSLKIRDEIQKQSALHKHPTEGCPIEENVFDRVLYCGVCGRKMTRNSYVKYYADGRKARLEGYSCLNSGTKKVAVCPDSNSISKTELMDILLPLIRMEFALFLEKPKHYIERGKEYISDAARKAEVRLSKTEGKIRRIREEESSVYMDYRAGKIQQKKYVSYKMEQEDKLADLRKMEEIQRNEIKSLEKLSEKYLSEMKAVLKLKSGKELTKDMVEALIFQIYVYPGKRIEVLFNCSVPSQLYVKADCAEGGK